MDYLMNSTIWCNGYRGIEGLFYLLQGFSLKDGLRKIDGENDVFIFMMQQFWIEQLWLVPFKQSLIFPPFVKISNTTCIWTLTTIERHTSIHFLRERERESNKEKERRWEWKKDIERERRDKEDVTWNPFVCK